MQYARMYTAPDGETHFADVPVDFRTVEALPGRAPIELSPLVPATQVAICRLPPGWEGGWHPSPQGGFSVILSGTLECTVSDGEARRFEPGQFVASDDVTGKGHLDRTVGPDAIVIMLVFMDPAAVLSAPA